MTDATHLTSDGTLLWVNRAGLVTAEQPSGKGKLFYLYGEEPSLEDFDLVPF
jgi:hypothetical protein